jgi:hypothetical protein
LFSPADASLVILLLISTLFTYLFIYFFWQSAILGMHSIVNRPMVVGGEIVSRPMMYIALTYDHRLIDGREAVFFLRRIKDVVEDPRRLLLDI